MTSRGKAMIIVEGQSRTTDLSSDETMMTVSKMNYISGLNLFNKWPANDLARPTFILLMKTPML